jgi:sugar lactone lactonase YvrE
MALAAAACSNGNGSGPNGSSSPTGTAAVGTVDTVAGTGAPGFSGEGSLATSAQLNQPEDVVIERSGNVLVADLGNQRVRRVDAGGRIFTVAGIGTSGFSGDGGPATAAELNHPAALALDGAGRLYIADRDNQRIRLVGGDGVIRTFAGTGAAGFAGDGGQALKARLNQPAGLAIDRGGDVFVADSGNARIRRIGPQGQITTVAGIGTRGYTGDGGPATAAQLTFPVDVVVDGRGDLFVADLFGDTVRLVRPDGTIHTLAGTGVEGFSGDGGPAGSAQLNHPSGLALDSDGNVYIADSGNGRIRKVAADGTITTVAGPGVALFAPGALPPTLARLGGLAVDTDGNLLLADAGGNRVGRLPL